jgi:hypothetical protein
MSIHVSSWVWKNSKAEGTELLVSLALADMANDEGYCWPANLSTIKSLAVRCRISERQVQRHLQSLTDRSELLSSQQFGQNGSQISNLYRFTAFANTPVTSVTPPPGDIEEEKVSPLLNGFSPNPPLPFSSLTSEKKKVRVADSDFIAQLKTNPAYKGIDVEREFGRMKAWLSAHHGRQLTRQFAVNWLNKVDPPLKLNGYTPRTVLQ